MKITKEQLKQIIKEELKSLEELPVGRPAGDLRSALLADKEKLHRAALERDLTPAEIKKYFWLLRKLEG